MTAPHRKPARTDLARRLALTALAIALPGLAGCAQKIPPTPESPTAAVVGSRTITLEEVDQTIKDALFARRFPRGDGTQLFDARAQALDQLIDQEVVTQAARGSGLEPSEWLTREAEARYPVAEEDIDAFLAQYQHRIPQDRPREQIRADVREYLAEESAKELLFELRQAARVRMVLARPRLEVEPRGVPRGPADAPVTIVEFSDFQCPFCARALPTVQKLLDQFPDDVRLYYRHVPLPSHARARPAAIAAVCAERQDQFWDYHDVLFANQGALGDADLVRYAEQVGIDLDAFEACRASPEAAARVDEDLAAASALGVTGTPVFFVNGVRIKGAQPLARFVQIVGEELAARSEP